MITTITGITKAEVMAASVFLDGDGFKYDEDYTTLYGAQYAIVGLQFPNADAAVVALGYFTFQKDAAPATYKLDDSTFDHLTAWCERETQTADEALELRGKMIDYVQSLPVEDAEYSVSHGWPHVRDLIQ